MNWPFVKRSTYDKLLAEYQAHEEHYWKQSAHNGMWERKAKELQKKLETR